MDLLEETALWEEEMTLQATDEGFREYLRTMVFPERPQVIDELFDIPETKSVVDMLKGRYWTDYVTGLSESLQADRDKERDYRGGR